MNKKIALKYLVVICVCFLLSISFSKAQTISGHFPNLANQKIKLEAFQSFKTYTVDSTTISKDGQFALRYKTSDKGMGFLTTEENKPLFIVLSGEAVEIKGQQLYLPETIQIVKGKENKIFEQYATDHPKREQALSAWKFLEEKYTQDPLFSQQKAAMQFISKEQKRIQQEDQTILKNLDQTTFISWYLPLRKLISQVANIAQYRPEEIVPTIEAFRKLDYSDPRLHKSGLLKDAIESQFWLIENSGLPLDSVFATMNRSIDAMLPTLMNDQEKLNTVTNYLFDLLERHSLFRSSEYLALKVLNEDGCTIENSLAKQLETYRAMRLGNTAPDFEIKGDIVYPNQQNNKLPAKLSDMISKYTLIVFGSSWCPKCVEEIPKIAQSYPEWNKQGVEVIFISLDTDKQTFNSFVSPFPFLSFCDYQKWESPVVESYYVFATPTMYLLDENQKIILRPNSVEHINSWVDWYLIKDNNSKKE